MMSGGHWEYRQYSVKDLLLDVGNDGKLLQRMPKLCQVFRSLAVLLDDTVHDLDWDLSSDTLIEDDEEFQSQFIKKLGELINQKCVVRVYEVDSSDLEGGGNS